jgi:DNA-binding NarL/FixJ family response regulator
LKDVRILLVESKKGVLADLPGFLAKISGMNILAELSEGVEDAVRRNSRKRFDAAVCCAERQEDLAKVIRLHKANSKVPILVLSAVQDGLFQQMALQLGATAVALLLRTPSEVALTISQALSTGDLASAINARSGPSQ